MGTLTGVHVEIGYLENSDSRLSGILLSKIESTQTFASGTGTIGERAGRGAPHCRVTTSDAIGDIWVSYGPKPDVSSASTNRRLLRATKGYEDYFLSPGDSLSVAPAS